MPNQVKELRELTGAGIMDCKRALDEAKGDLELAKKIIAEKGQAKADNKADRATGAGLLHSYIHGNRVGVLLLMRCETDFVSKNETFQNLTHEIAMHIAALNPTSVEELLAQPFVKNPSETIEGLIKAAIGTIGENIKVDKFARFAI